ncbi:aliphatic sulfonate ABC transporter substrate-binding protein [Glacieibacterium frigidum]|uniref:Putative aliphatic sulfonates-binding protein n=1 Tax=Glacieibacterium frigidum TaxID=2593303 RepID=A0A552U7S2_9SPHN|nr:aliphatic sulfonate ABC transporter substrate-binding protein [Glacieibacterium frigidum]TRW14265.1 aliphatic sulfonate ABC transporter substrate-binding protein [Glacieibacterium frigidum]
MMTRRLVVGSPLALAACGGPARLRIGYQKNGLLLIARERATPAADWREFPSGPPLLEAMSVGGLDLGGTGDTPPIVAQASGANIVYVAAQPVSGAAAAILVPRGSALRTAADLRGRRVAWLRGSSAQGLVAGVLADAGLTVGDIEAVNLAPDAAAGAFAGGSLDAWAVWDPYFAAAEAEGARVLVPGRPLAASNSFILANRDFARDYPRDLTAALDALAGTARWAAANRPALAALITRAAKLHPNVATRVAARQDLTLVPLTAAIITREQEIADALFRDASIPARVDVGAAVWRGWAG